MADIIDLDMWKKKKELDTEDLADIELSKLFDDALDIEYLSVELSKDLMVSLIDQYNVDPHADPKLIYDILGFIEATKALMYRTQGTYYPLQVMNEHLHIKTVKDPEALLNQFIDELYVDI